MDIVSYSKLEELESVVMSDISNGSVPVYATCGTDINAFSELLAITDEGKVIDFDANIVSRDNVEQLSPHARVTSSYIVKYKRIDGNHIFRIYRASSSTVKCEVLQINNDATIEIISSLTVNVFEDPRYITAFVVDTQAGYFMFGIDSAYDTSSARLYTGKFDLDDAYKLKYINSSGNMDLRMYNGYQYSYVVENGIGFCTNQEDTHYTLAFEITNTSFEYGFVDLSSKAPSTIRIYNLHGKGIKYNGDYYFFGQYGHTLIKVGINSANYKNPTVTEYNIEDPIPSYYKVLFWTILDGYAIQVAVNYHVKGTVKVTQYKIEDVLAGVMSRIDYDIILDNWDIYMNSPSQYSYSLWNVLTDRVAIVDSSTIFFTLIEGETDDNYNYLYKGDFIDGRLKFTNITRLNSCFNTYKNTLVPITTYDDETKTAKIFYPPSDDDRVEKAEVIKLNDSFATGTKIDATVLTDHSVDEVVKLYTELPSYNKEDSMDVGEIVGDKFIVTDKNVLVGVKK